MTCGLRSRDRPARGQPLGRGVVLKDQGDVQDRVLLVVETTDVLSIEARDLPNGEWVPSPPIPVSAYAGQTVQLFYGFNSSGVIGGQLEVRNLSFVRQPAKLGLLPTAANQLFLCWPTPAKPYQLQETANLADPAAWHDVTTTPNFDGYEYSLTLPISGSQKFYRLRRLP